MRPASVEDLHEICRSLPETELGVTWGDVPTYVVPRGPKGRGFCLFRPARDALIEDERLPFFTIDHFRNHDTVAVLVRQSQLGEIDVNELRELLTEAWLGVAPKRLARQHFPNLV